MATLLNTKMPYWAIKVANTDCTGLFKKYTSSITCTYSVDKKGTSMPATASIEVTSPSFIEDFLKKGMPVKITMGYSQTGQVQMIDGEITELPEGMASESINYTLEITDKVINLAKYSKNRNDFPSDKTSIATIIICENGYTPVVDIDDTNKFNIDKIPMQKNESDLQFLTRLAKQWNCVWWVRKTMFYFVDASKAHDYGDIDRDFHINDSATGYPLNYRLAIGRNNVSKISWKKESRQGGDGASLAGLKGADESGLVSLLDDYRISYYGEVWQLKKEVKDTIVKNPSLLVTYSKLTDSAVAYKDTEKLKQYFVPVTHSKDGAQGHADKSHTAAHKAKGFIVEVELNVGDPYLRTPRTGLLSCGTADERMSYLPGYLMHEGKNGSRYNINTVETSLRNGMIQTKLQMTA